MRKIIVFLSLICIFITGCSMRSEDNSTDSVENDNSNLEGETHEEFDDFNINDFVANITDANGLGIKHQKSSVESKRKNRSSSGENVLVKTTTEYGEGDIIISDNKIEEVTFTKIDTTVNTEKIMGEVEYTANQKDGSITFKAYNGFEYTVNHDNTTLFSGIEDNDENDCEKSEGIITIKGLTKGKSYKVSYVGYGEEITVTQSKVGGEIDKICVLDGRFTFTSFVPKGLSNRPYGESLTLDQDGVAIYDKIDYISSNTRKNYVLDNYSGFVYDLQDVNVSKVDCNLVIVNNEYCDLTIDDAGNLLFTPICKNKTLNVRYAFKDKYGNKYILNDKLETYDAKTNTYYYVTGSAIYENNDINCSVNSNKRYCYVRTSDDEVVRFPVHFLYPHEMMNDSQTVDIILSDGEFRPLNETDTFDIYSYNDGAYFIYEPKNVLNGVLRIMADYNGNINKNSFRGYARDEGFYYLQNQDGQAKCYYLAAGCMNAINPYYVDQYDVMFVVFEGTVYCFKNCFEYAKMMEVIQETPAIWLGNGYMAFEVDDTYVFELVNDVTVEDGKLIKYGVDGNQSFDVFVEGTMENPIVNLYETGTYTPPQVEETAIVIQPINR